MSQEEESEFKERLEFVEKLVLDFYNIEHEAFAYRIDTEPISVFEIKDRIHAVATSDFKLRIRSREREEDIAIDICNKLIRDQGNAEKLK